MGIDTKLPEIAALRERTETLHGTAPRVHADFVGLTDAIFLKISGINLMKNARIMTSYRFFQDEVILRREAERGGDHHLARRAWTGTKKGRCSTQCPFSGGR